MVRVTSRRQRSPPASTSTTARSTPVNYGRFRPGTPSRRRSLMQDVRRRALSLSRGTVQTGTSSAPEAEAGRRCGAGQDSWLPPDCNRHSSTSATSKVRSCAPSTPNDCGTGVLSVGEDLHGNRVFGGTLCATPGQRIGILGFRRRSQFRQFQYDIAAYLLTRATAGLGARLRAGPISWASLEDTLVGCVVRHRRRRHIS